jgi:hypothetical protein
MTDSKDAIIKLLAKVEAGDWCTKLALKALPESHVNDSHEWIDPIGWASRAIHNGSLDAAKALHEAVLPKWEVYSLAQNSARNWWIRLDLPVVGDDDGNIIRNSISCCSFDKANPARAWLIAILKALIAGEDTNTNDKGE